MGFVNTFIGFLRQWLHNIGHGPKMKAIADKMEVFRNKLAGSTYLQGYDETGRSNRKNETLAVWLAQVVRKHTGL